MCGIIGYSGPRSATEVLLNGLSALEYRGYDSAGVSVFCDGKLKTVKTAGRIAALSKLLKETPLDGNCGIGHTRWATHGAPSDINAHPHSTDRLSLVHNGIIENYAKLKENLAQKGYSFKTQTDTEVVAKLLDCCYNGDPVEAIERVCTQIEGSYALVIAFNDRPGELYGTCLNSPLLAARGKNEGFLVSDISAALSYTDRYCVLDCGEIAKVSPNGVIEIVKFGGTKVDKPFLTAQWEPAERQKNGYEHFMLKEIFEQPAALHNTVYPRIVDGLPDFNHDNISHGYFAQFDSVQIVACGTASYAGLAGKNIIEKLARVPSQVDIASEFRYRDPILNPKQLVLVISQSGETADTLAALRLAKSRGCRTLAIVNVKGSIIAHEAHDVIYTYAGPEIAVASTKAYSVQVAILYLIAIRFALEKQRISPAEAEGFTAGLLDAMQKTSCALKTDPLAKEIARKIKDTQNLFFMGRGLDFPLCREGSLKLKEVSYIHSEACEAGEMKHGTISLITDGVPVIAVATQTSVLPKTISNIKETRSRGARVLLICQNNADVGDDVYDEIIRLPDTEDLFAPILGIIPLQLLAYHTAVAKGCDVDKPRNLAKSVTVE